MFHENKINIRIRYYLLVLFSVISLGTFAKSQKDSISTLTAKQKAEAVVGSLFKPTPGLNNADSIIQLLDKLPAFGIFKSNYFLIGTSLTGTPTAYNSDVKFQISVRQRLTNSVLPFKSYLLLTYTQLTFWNVFQESFPFGDINFNPTIGLGRSLVYHNRYLGVLGINLEHESNGKDGLNSRSWNKVSFTGLFKINDLWAIQPKVWIPMVDGINNKDIVNYKGWGFITVDYTLKSKFDMSLMLNKRGGANLNTNVTFSVSFRPFKTDNQFLYLQYFDGYGESLLDYNQYRQRLRIGFVIKPDFLIID